MERGSEKLLAAWKARQLTDQSVQDIAEGLGKSSAEVHSIEFHGGARPTGVAVGLTYRDGTIEECGTDITLWLAWLRRYAAEVEFDRRILIDGVWPDLLTVTLPFGNVGHLQAEAHGQV